MIYSRPESKTVEWTNLWISILYPINCIQRHPIIAVTIDLILTMTTAYIDIPIAHCNSPCYLVDRNRRSRSSAFGRCKGSSLSD